MILWKFHLHYSPTTACSIIRNLLECYGLIAFSKSSSLCIPIHNEEDFMYQCKWCDVSYDSYLSIARHVKNAHGVDRVSARITYFHDGVVPLCKCGCGTPTKFHASGFMDYVSGHNSKVANSMAGKNHTETTKRSISKARKEKFKNGEYRVWQLENTEETIERFKRIADKTRNNKERGLAISKALTGVPKSESHKANSRKGIKKAWENPELRERQSNTRMLMITSNGWAIRSKLETKLENQLMAANINFHTQHYVREIKSLYDFYIPKPDGTYFLVEVHGNYWHCKPGTVHEIPKYKCQVRNIRNDEKKAEWCRANNISLLIIWEDEIEDGLNKILQLLSETTYLLK